MGTMVIFSLFVSGLIKCVAHFDMFFCDVFFAFCGYEMGCLLILHGNECYSVVLNYFLILPCLTRNFSLSNNDPPFLLPHECTFIVLYLLSQGSFSRSQITS